MLAYFIFGFGGYPRIIKNKGSYRKVQTLWNLNYNEYATTWKNVGLDPNFTLRRLLTVLKEHSKTVGISLLNFIPVFNTLSDSVFMLMSSRLLRILRKTMQRTDGRPFFQVCQNYCKLIIIIKTNNNQYSLSVFITMFSLL